MQRGDKSTWLERTGSNQLSTGHRLGQFLLFNTDESPCQDSLDNWTPRRSPDHRKETQTAMARSSRSSGLAKTILQGTVKGGRSQRGQRKRWEDNIREWTGREFAKCQRAAENREKLRKLVMKSSVVSQRPSRLRDR